MFPEQEAYVLFARSLTTLVSVGKVTPGPCSSALVIAIDHDRIFKVLLRIIAAVERNAILAEIMILMLL